MFVATDEKVFANVKSAHLKSVRHVYPSMNRVINKEDLNEKYAFLLECGMIPLRHYNIFSGTDQRNAKACITFGK